MATFAQLLEALMSPDNARRKSAEAAYEKALENPAKIISHLVQTVATDDAEARRSMATILLRRLVCTQSDWTTLAPPVQEQLKAGLLAALNNETVAHVRRKLCHCIASVTFVAVPAPPAPGTEAPAAGPPQTWPELLPAVFKLVQAEDPQKREAALFLYGKLAEYGNEVLLEPHATKLLALYGSHMADAHLAIATAAADATVRLVVCLPTEEVRKAAAPMIPAMMGVLEKLLRAHQEELACNLIEGLTTVVDHESKVLRAYFAGCATAMISIIKHAEFEDSTRKLAFEFMLAMAENAGAVVRKQPAVVEALLAAALQFLSAIEDDGKWVTRDENPGDYQSDENDSDARDLLDVGAQAINRLSIAVGGKVFLPLFRKLTAPMLASPDWRQRRAALIAMSLAVVGCKEQLRANLRAVVEDMARFVKDPHVRVRHSAVRFLGQLAADFNSDDNDAGEDMTEAVAREVTGGDKAPGTGSMSRTTGGDDEGENLQELAGDVILAALIESLQPANPPRLRGLASSALVNLLHPDMWDDDMVEDIVLPKADELMTRLTAAVVSTPPAFRYARGFSIVAIGAAATVLEAAFAKYYPAVVPGLKSVVSSCTTVADSGLRGKALESLTLCFQAVGKAVAAADAGETLKVVLSALRQPFAAEDQDGYRHTVVALSRIANTLGADFAPFFNFAFPLLLEKATMKITVELTDASDPMDKMRAAEAAEKKMQSVVVRAGRDSDESSGMRVAMDSQAVSEKVYALSTLADILESMAVDVPAFAAWVDRFGETLMKVAGSSFVAMRESAARAFPFLLQAGLADTSDPAHGDRILRTLMPTMTERLEREKDMDMRGLVAEAVVETCRLAWRSTTPEFNGANAPDAGGAAAKPSSPPSGSPGSVPQAAPAETKFKFNRAVLPLDLMPQFFESVASVMERSKENRIAVARDVLSDPDHDAEDESRLETFLADFDDEISNMTDTVGYCIKTHREAILPALATKLGPLMQGYMALRGRETQALRAAGLCMCIDLIEFASPKSHVLLPKLVPEMIECLKHPDPALRQPAAYCVGVLAQYASAALGPVMGTVLPLVNQIVTAPEARSPEHGSATDNAVSSLIKIAKFCGAGLNVDNLMKAVLTYLPMIYDGIEARLVHGWMVNGLAKGEQLWIGPGGSRVPDLLGALARGLLQHRLNTEGLKEGEDDKGLLDTEEDLFEDTTLTQLPRIADAVKASPVAAAVAGYIRAMKPQLRDELTQRGFPA